MKKRKLGNIEVSTIGMGCMGFSHGYGQIPDRQYSIEAIRMAYEAGCTFFDTAEGYGSVLYWPGHNEQIVGEAVQDFRKNIVIATKFRVSKDIDIQNTAEVENNIRDHLAQSMKNLKTDYVDLYYLHRYNKEMSIETIAEIMGKLIDEKKIGGWGLSQINPELLKKAHAITPVSAVQSLYNMVERDAEKELLPFCLHSNIGFVPFSPTSSGLFSGKLSKQSDFSHSDDVRKYVPQLKKENIEGNQPIIDLIMTYADRKKATGTQIALVWMLKKYPNVVPIPGSKNKERILENLSSANIILSDEEFTELDTALCAMPVYGHRGTVEYDGSSMNDWGKLK